MGNSNEFEENLDSFYMHIQIIGKDMNKFLGLISGRETPSKAKSDPKERKKIEDFWDFDYNKDKSIKDQIDEYFQNLFDIKEKNIGKDLKEVLVVKVDNSFDITIDFVLQKINELRVDYLMPIVLFLVVNDTKEVLLDKTKYPRIKENLIVSKKYSEDSRFYGEDKQMTNLFLRFCSIHNELGDYFTLGKEPNVNCYDLIENYYPFNLNLCCIGRFGQGKSTGVNVLLNEYKAKESSKGAAQTRNLTFYQASNAPIRVLDIPGFDSEKNVNSAIDRLKMCYDEVNKLKDYIHFFLYFLKDTDDRIFTEFESPIIEEIIKYTESKVIYVVTHSDPDAEEEDRKEFITKINQGIRKQILKVIPEEKKELVINMMTATKDNVVFLNFHNDIKLKRVPFGKNKLFKTICDYFKNSKFFINATKNLDPSEVKKRAAILKQRANSSLKWNKVGGSLIGIIPGVDWFIQKSVIKKSVAKKIGGVFGINVNFLNKEQERLKKKEEKLKIELNNTEEDKLMYAGTSLDLEINGDNLIEDSSQYKIGNSFKVAGDAGSMIGGGISFGVGVVRAVGQTTVDAVNVVGETVAIGSTTLKVVGTACIILGTVVGVASGAYFTCKHCNEMIDFFEKYYIENASKICNSYFYALEYLRSNAGINELETHN